jgi:nuclear pore complex protein Nup98-Nup96
MFGTTTATAGGSGGFGGFGGTNTTNNTGGLFGGTNKPAFGGGGTTGGSIFGGGSGSSVFGSTANQPTSAFGAPISSALGATTAECQGTGSTPFQAHTEKESGSTVTNHFQSISFMQPYKNFSFEVGYYLNIWNTSSANLF